MKKIFTLSFVCFLLMIGMADGQTHLWGIASRGGATNNGTIFNSDVNGNNFHTVFSFVDSLGANPLGALVMANNRKFYGVTQTGGCNNYGVCYSFDPASGVYADIHDFGCDTINGWGAMSGLTLASDGNLYGLCQQSGSANLGVLYKINPATNNYTKLYDFVDPAFGHPDGTLIQLSDGKLYGMANTDSNGIVIFNFNTVDSLYTNLSWYNYGTNQTDWFFGGLLKATNSKLYGMTKWGGYNGWGIIFNFDLSTDIFSDVHDFGSNQGVNPLGSLIQATNGLLYGMTASGGTNGPGVIFSFDISTNSYIVLHNFNDSFGTGGGSPERSLMQASNGLLFGTASDGGNTGHPGVFLVIILLLILILIYLILME